MRPVYRSLTFIAFLISVAWMIFAPGFGPAIAIVGSVAAVFSKEFHGVIGAHLLSLTPRNSPVRSLAHTRYSFSREEFIHPLILNDLCGWLSDTGDQIVSVNVLGANDSNRYFGEIEFDAGETPPVVRAIRDQSYFAYQYLGRSFSGMHLLQTWSSGGGSGVFCNILLVTLGEESAVEIGPDGVSKVDRFIVKKIATIPLGDRYNGALSYRFGLLTIAKCRGTASLRNRKQRLLIL
jgi:hypothetical protein